MTERMYAAIGAAFFFAGAAILTRATFRHVRRVKRFHHCSSLFRHARLDIQHGAEPMRIARAGLAALGARRA